ncbi:ribosomal protein S18-alanine N-acetyltransferase [uncultured Williamsia sp.]|uniref:ribosomal protein S18-alanine N-acetyltransferase n=1 Tax=uncultured Williamsia sp. TaxID=259311 RepID=UPI00261A3A9A|nr:ribosomal protein S18-alanine N-acetyltransferase [uncultured Williamsia sp.]
MTTIAPLTVDDAPRCAELERAIFADESPWPVEAFVAEIGSSRNRYVGVRDDRGVLVGYAGISVLGRVGGYECEIHTIALDPDHRGSGVGRALLRSLLDVADDRQAETFLEVRTDNDAAISLYESVGFERLGLRKGYYQPIGADAYTMRRPPLGAGPRSEGVAR